MNEIASHSPKKVLIITYYWPPSGGSGVQRWLKFVKYLPQFGVEPVVFTPENPSFEIRDDSLLKDIPPQTEVIRFPIWEPYRAFQKVSGWLGRKPTAQTDLITTGKKSLFQKITTWVRGNLFIPDARIFWVKPSVSFLPDILKSNDIHTIITTGPPHSLHLIGLKLKKKNPDLKWIVDLRDPWSEWDLLDTLSLSARARKRHQKLEREVLTLADQVITIAPFHAARFGALGGRKVELITNGYDEEDFIGIKRVRTTKFTIRHIGMVDELRDPRPFMEALKQLMMVDSDFSMKVVVEFIGSVNRTFQDFVKGDPVLSQVTVFSKPVPHAELLKLYGGTDVQLLVLAFTVLAPGNLPGKLFEYMASGNFILGIGPADGDAASILRQTNSGVIVERNDRDGLVSELQARFKLWTTGADSPRRAVNSYSRKELTRQLVNLLEKK